MISISTHTTSNTVGREAISVSKERGRQEAVRMADNFQNQEKDQRQPNINKPRQMG